MFNVNVQEVVPESGWYYKREDKQAFRLFGRMSGVVTRPYVAVFVAVDPEGGGDNQGVVGGERGGVWR